MGSACLQSIADLLAGPFGANTGCEVLLTQNLRGGSALGLRQNGGKTSHRASTSLQIGPKPGITINFHEGKWLYFILAVASALRW